MWYNKDWYSVQRNLFFSFSGSYYAQEKKISLSPHVFFTNNSTMHLEWHVVSIFFRGLQFVFILHTNSYIQSDQRLIYPPYCVFSKG